MQNKLLRAIVNVVGGRGAYNISLKVLFVCSILATGSLSLGGCGASGSSSSSPAIQSLVSIDEMTVVPVINGSSTKGTLYIHNYGNTTINKLNFSLNNETSNSSLKSLLSKVGLNLKGSVANKSGFTLLNPELCGSIAAGGSCEINFSTPGLSVGDKGNSLVTLKYNSGNNTYQTSQVVSYQYTSLDAVSGINFTGGLRVVGAQGSTQHVVGYLYAAGIAGNKYTGVNLDSSSSNTHISGGFVNGQEVAVGQVIAVEFASELQGSKATTVNVVPRTSGLRSSSQGLKSVHSTGGILSLQLTPSQNTANIIFGSIPLLNAPTTSPAIINVTNNGNAASSSAITASSSNPDLAITNTCNTPLQANAADSCQFSFSVSNSVPGTATVTFSDGSSTVGTQTVIWTNATPVPAVSITPNMTEFSLGINHDQSESAVILTVTNVGNAPLNNASYGVTNTGSAIWEENGNTCQNSLAQGASCSITGRFKAGSNDGTGVFYEKVSGGYNNINYSFVQSPPIRYMITAQPNLEITTEDSTNLTLLANGANIESITYTISNNCDDNATITSMNETNLLNALGAPANVEPVINGGTCSTSFPFDLAAGDDCTVIITYGTSLQTNNESGVGTLSVAYNGGTPYISPTVQTSFNYQVLGNDSVLIISPPVATNLTGNGTSDTPFYGTSGNLTPMTITTNYTNQSTNESMVNFNLDTTKLPFGYVVDSSSTCANSSGTPSFTQTLAIGGTCSLVLRLNPELLAKSSQGGSVVSEISGATASWTTSFGFYSQNSDMIYANYLQPTISFTLSDNNGRG